MRYFAASRRRFLSSTPGAHPASGALSVEIRLSVPAGATPDDVSRILTSALVEIAEEYGDSLQIAKVA